MNNRVQIEAADLSGMVTHWLGCPPGGYLGSDYGSDVKSLLQTPMASGMADALIEKCRADIPLLALARPGTVNVGYSDLGIDRRSIVFEVAGELIDVVDQG
jgi:hypothetical protein